MITLDEKNFLNKYITDQDLQLNRTDYQIKFDEDIIDITFHNDGIIASKQDGFFLVDPNNLQVSDSIKLIDIIGKTSLHITEIQSWNDTGLITNLSDNTFIVTDLLGKNIFYHNKIEIKNKINKFIEHKKRIDEEEVSVLTLVYEDGLIEDYTYYIYSPVIYLSKEDLFGNFPIFSQSHNLKPNEFNNYFRFKSLPKKINLLIRPDNHPVRVYDYFNYHSNENIDFVMNNYTDPDREDETIELQTFTKDSDQRYVFENEYKLNIRFISPPQINCKKELNIYDDNGLNFVDTCDNNNKDQFEFIVFQSGNSMIIYYYDTNGVKNFVENDTKYPINTNFFIDEEVGAEETIGFALLDKNLVPSSTKYIRLLISPSKSQIWIYILIVISTILALFLFYEISNNRGWLGFANIKTGNYSLYSYLKKKGCLKCVGIKEEPKENIYNQF